MENKPVYARKPYLSTSLYGFSYGLWGLGKKEGVFLLDSEVENDTQASPLIYLISLATFYSKILLLEWVKEKYYEEIMNHAAESVAKFYMQR